MRRFWRPAETPKMPKDGKHLEERVARLYKKLGKKNVRKNVILVDQSGNRSEIDVCYGFVFLLFCDLVSDLAGCWLLFLFSSLIVGGF